jgi:hypothetical protein
LCAAGSELGVLKWRFQSRDESLVPLSLSCWPSASGSECYVNMEYESSVDYDLEHVVIAIPLPHMSHAPQVNQVRARAVLAAKAASSQSRCLIGALSCTKHSLFEHDH